MPSRNNALQACRVIKKEKLSPEVSSFTLEAVEASFNGLEPGCHIDVYLDGGLIRQYSPWQWSEDSRQLTISVKREDQGSGGSIKMHQLNEGDVIEIDGPRNNFKLVEGAAHYVMLAGGIGVTPIYPMVEQLQRENASFDVYYLVQAKHLAAFDKQFQSLGMDNYRLHDDSESGYMNFNELFKELPKGSAIFTCGPEPMLAAVLDAAENNENKPEVHFERFAASTTYDANDNVDFTIKINSSGDIFPVGADESILEVLQKNDIDIEYGCSEGVCGTCITDVLEGEIEHRDEVLSDDEKASNEFMCVCVSRAKSKQLLLDL